MSFVPAAATGGSHSVNTDRVSDSEISDARDPALVALPALPPLAGHVVAVENVAVLASLESDAAAGVLTPRPEPAAPASSSETGVTTLKQAAAAASDGRRGAEHGVVA